MMNRQQEVRSMRARCSFRPTSSAGFTLIELMIVMVIGAILLTIAVPAYTSQVRKSRRTEARTALLDLAAREERFSSTNSSYTVDPAKLGYSGVFPAPVGSSYYQITVTDATATTFNATAAPINAQATDNQCGTFKIDNTGTQDVTGTAGAAACWN
jgi:type IV pilus assembly protein PilE